MAEISGELKIPDAASSIITPSGNSLAGILARLLYYFDFDEKTIQAFRNENLNKRTTFSDMDEAGRYSTKLGGAKIAGFRDHYLVVENSPYGCESKREKCQYILNRDLTNYLDGCVGRWLMPSLFEYVSGKKTREELDYFITLTMTFFKEFVIRIILGMESGDYEVDERRLNILEAFYFVYQNMYYHVPASWSSCFNEYREALAPSQAKRKAKRISDPSGFNKFLFLGVLPIPKIGSEKDLLISYIKREITPIFCSIRFTLRNESASEVYRYLPALFPLFRAISQISFPK